MHEPRYRLLAVFFVLGALAMFLPIHFTLHAAFWDKLLDPSHMLFFGGVTWLLVMTNPLGIVGHRPCLVVAMLLSTAIAAAVEILQPLTGRDQSLGDFREGVFGVALVGSAMWHPFARRSRTFLIAWCATAALLVVIGLEPAWEEVRGLIWRAQNFPLLADFESEDEMHLWYPSGPDDRPAVHIAMARQSGYASHGDYSLFVYMGPDPWPGVRLLCDDQDWTGYTAFAFDIFNSGPSCDLALRIDDDDAESGRNGRFYRALQLQQGRNHFRIPLIEIEHGSGVRSLHMSAIRRVVFFRDHPHAGCVAYFDYLRLER